MCAKAPSPAASPTAGWRDNKEATVRVPVSGRPTTKSGVQSVTPRPFSGNRPENAFRMLATTSSSRSGRGAGGMSDAARSLPDPSQKPASSSASPRPSTIAARQAPLALDGGSSPAARIPCLCKACVHDLRDSPLLPSAKSIPAGAEQRTHNGAECTLRNHQGTMTVT